MWELIDLVMRINNNVNWVVQKTICRPNLGCAPRRAVPGILHLQLHL